MKRLWMLLTVVLAIAVAGVATPAWAGPPPFDPKQMSGIPRPDPQVPPGTITVRVLGEDGFSDPVVGVDVTLEVRGSDGSSKTFTEKTVTQGRATFIGLEAFAGGKAVAKADLGGKTYTTLPIDIRPSSGSRVMLVQGAPDRAAGTPPASGPASGAAGHGQAGGAAVPMPGNAFPLRQSPKGVLTIGTFDLAAKKPIANIDVTLTITPPEGEPIVRNATTDRGGKVVFENLLPPDIPEGSRLEVRGTLVVGGQERVSEPFSMDPDSGMALVLAEGADSFTPDAATGAGRAPQRQPLPGPRVMRTLPEGQVRVRIVDSSDVPVKGQALVLVKKTAGGGVEKREATTGDSGLVLIEDVGVQADALYFVQTVYDSGPYQSRFFGMDRRGGIAVDLRVFPTTSDRSVVRSALQYDVDELENDLAQIVQIYEVMVDGDKAFWEPEGLLIEAMPGAKGFTVLRPAEAFLDHDESAPFASLHGPIPPGQLVNLSVGYLLDHEGEVEVDWVPPFEIIESSVMVGETFALDAPGATESDLKSQVPDKKVYTLGPKPLGTPVKFGMSGLRTRNPIYRQVGMWGGIAMGVALVLAFAFHQRGSTRQRLERRRDELLGLLERGDQKFNREQILVSLDRIYRKLRALHAMHSEPGPKKPAEKKKRA